MNHAFRLTRGEDLKKEIINYAKVHHIDAGVVTCAVGSLSHVHIRLADAKDYINRDGLYEIVSITGTLSQDDVHIHISVADNKGNVIGGHLKDECIIHTTAEVVLYELDNFIFTREFDEETGYKELKIKKR